MNRIISTAWLHPLIAVGTFNQLSFDNFKLHKLPKYTYKCDDVQWFDSIKVNAMQTCGEKKIRLIFGKSD